MINSVEKYSLLDPDSLVMTTFSDVILAVVTVGYLLVVDISFVVGSEQLLLVKMFPKFGRPKKSKAFGVDWAGTLQSMIIRIPSSGIILSL